MASMGMLIGVGVVLVLSIVVFAVMMRNRPRSRPAADAPPQGAATASAPASQPATAASGPHQPATAAPGPHQPATAPKPRQAATLSMLPQVAATSPNASASELKMVSCEVDGKLHGAMPPFGRLVVEDGGFAFEAASRVVALSGALASGDGASTMQSVGNIEMGKFRYDIALTQVAATAFEGGHKAVIEAEGRRYVFEGFGPSAKLLHDWLRGRGLQG